MSCVVGNIFGTVAPQRRQLMTSCLLKEKDEKQDGAMKRSVAAKMRKLQDPKQPDRKSVFEKSSEIKPEP